MDISNGLRVEDPIPAGQVPLMKEKFSGIGGETLRDHPHITSYLWGAVYKRRLQSKGRESLPKYDLM